MKATNTRTGKNGKTYLAMSEAQQRVLTNHAEKKIKEIFSTWSTPDEFEIIMDTVAEEAAVQLIENILITPID